MDLLGNILEKIIGIWLKDWVRENKPHWIPGLRFMKKMMNLILIIAIVVFIVYFSIRNN
jgi:hypothetical protein